MPPDRPLILATRGSPLALAQARSVAAACLAAFPQLRCEFLIVKTTGDKLQRASLATETASLPKGLFTKELETALLEGAADLAVHSLKDLPTELPPGLELSAVLERADPRDVLIHRAPPPAAPPPPSPTATHPAFALAALPPGAVVATSSTRRREQLRHWRPDLALIEIRGNVHTRLRKVADPATCDATLLAAAGLARLGFRVAPDRALLGPDLAAQAPGQPATAQTTDPDPSLVPPPPPLPAGLQATFLPLTTMLPCVGQAAIGLEARVGDERVAAVCCHLNHRPTSECVTAERAFLQALGGGCQSPVAAWAEVLGDHLRVRGVSFRSGPARWAEADGPRHDPRAVGERLAERLR